MNERTQKLRDALLKIENLGAESPTADNSLEMFRIANTALAEDDKYFDPTTRNDVMITCSFCGRYHSVFASCPDAQPQQPEGE